MDNNKNNEDNNIIPADHKLCGYLITVLDPNNDNISPEFGTCVNLITSLPPKLTPRKNSAKKTSKKSIIGGGGSGGGAVASVVTQIKTLIHHKCLRVVATIVGVSEGGDGVRVVVLVDVYLPEVVWWNDWQFPRCGTTAVSLFQHLR